MTAFARKEQQIHWGHTIWELRSVNHRYLDVSFYLPESLHYLEPLLRKQLSQKIRRGKIEVRLRYNPPASTALPTEINETLALCIIQVHKKLAVLTQTPDARLDPTELLRWPQLLKLPEIIYAKLQADLMTLFLEALADFCATRAREGDAIFEVIMQRLIGIQNLINTIRTELPHILALQRERVLTRLTEIKINLDCSNNRLEQEMLLFAQKMDVAEELDRLQIHLNEFKRLIKEHASGKQLDFLLQELHREANTLAAKSLNAQLSLIVVNVKVFIEEIREQVQNIE